MNRWTDGRTYRHTYVRTHGWTDIWERIYNSWGNVENKRRLYIQWHYTLQQVNCYCILGWSFLVGRLNGWSEFNSTFNTTLLLCTFTLKFIIQKFIHLVTSIIFLPAECQSLAFSTQIRLYCDIRIRHLAAAIKTNWKTQLILLNYYILKMPHTHSYINIALHQHRLFP